MEAKKTHLEWNGNLPLKIKQNSSFYERKKKEKNVRNQEKKTRKSERELWNL
jgi:hypothetical protein